MSKTILKSIAIGKLRANPYRNIKHYPIHKGKVSALRDSFKATWFWENIFARPAKGGTYEIAYGHHRLAALKEEYDELKQVQILVRDLSNEEMLKMMIRENLEEWGSDAWVEMEAVKQTISAYGKGDITLPKMDMRGTKEDRIFTTDVGRKDFSRIQIARFCGMMKGKAHANYAFDRAWEAIQAEKEKIVTPAVLKNLSREEAAVVVSNAVRQKKQDDTEANRLEKAGKVKAADNLRKQAVSNAKDIATESAAELRAGVGVRKVRGKAKEQPKPTRPVNMDQFCLRVMGRINKLMEDGSEKEADSIKSNLALVRKHKADASASAINDVQKCLDNLVRRVKSQKVKG
jgi:ParB-like chromosome segregation protein Spo0J